MVDVEKLKEEELIQLNKEEETDEEFLDLEELILLGQDKKIPIIIQYPLPNGREVKSKVLVKQLTLKEFENIKLANTDLLQLNLKILQRALFTLDGKHLSKDQIIDLPIGTVRAITNKILELSGMDEKTRSALSNF